MNNQQTYEQGSLLVGVNEMADPDNPSSLERRHVPAIEAPDRVRKNEGFTVTLEVGKVLEHPNDCGHFIQFIDLYADDTFLTRTDFTAVRVCPKVSLCIALQYPVQHLRAFACCNLHGTWISKKAINVEE